MAEDYLKKKGYKILERNYRCPLGELDLVVVDGKVVVLSRSKFAATIFSARRWKP